MAEICLHIPSTVSTIQEGIILQESLHLREPTPFTPVGKALIGNLENRPVIRLNAINIFGTNALDAITQLTERVSAIASKPQLKMTYALNRFFFAPLNRRIYRMTQSPNQEESSSAILVALI